MKQLTPKQIRFVDEYLIDLNAKQACIRAGYSPKSAEFQGSKLLADSKVKQEIDARNVKIAKKFEVTREELLKDLVDIKNNCKTAFPPSSIKSIEILNKMLGYNEPEKIEHSGNVGLDINIIINKPKDGKEPD